MTENPLTLTLTLAKCREALEKIQRNSFTNPASKAYAREALATTPPEVDAVMEVLKYALLWKRSNGSYYLYLREAIDNLPPEIKELVEEK